MDRETALSICRRAVGYATTDDAIVVLREGREGATRFSNNVITQNVAERKASLSVIVAFGKRRGEVSVNRFDESTLRDAVARAEAIAKVAPEDEEHMPPVEPCKYTGLPGGVVDTMETDPGARASSVKQAIDIVDGDDRTTAGAFSTGGSFIAFANSRGASGSHSRSSADLRMTVLTDSSSGWTEAYSRDRSEVDAERTARRAVELAEMARDPRSVEPGEYAVVLDPEAVTTMVAYFLFSADAKAADEKRSPFTDKEGEKLLSDSVTIRTTLADEFAPDRPFDQSGAPLSDVTWVENGVLRSLHTSRYWAQHTGRPYTPAITQLFNVRWGEARNVQVDGGHKTTEDLIRGVDRGLYVTRFWYNRYVDPMKLLITGMTRDGLYLIEDGKIVAGLKHLRYNDSPLDVLSSVREIGRPEVHGMGHIPPILVDRLRFTSSTSF